MARSARELFEEAMRLAPEERATLMRLLADTVVLSEQHDGVSTSGHAGSVSRERRIRGTEAVTGPLIGGRL